MMDLPLVNMIRMVSICALAALSTGLGAATSEPSKEPKITSIFPLGGQPGRTYAAQIRGRDLMSARGIWFRESGLRARVVKVESLEASSDILYAEVTVEESAPIGRRALRVATGEGVSNEIELQVLPALPVHTGPSDAALAQFPVSVDGRLEKRGAVNSYPLDVLSGQTLTFEVTSGFRGFDPLIAIAEKSGSWFDAERLNRVAANDEPLYFPGLSQDARLVHRFEKAGRYWIQISAFMGQGGPDYVYHLRITPLPTPSPDLHPRLSGFWDERQFTRAMGSGWMALVAGRGGVEKPAAEVESFRAAPEGSAAIPVMSPPGIVEGRIARPGETHVIQVKIDKAQDLAIEIETPGATMPRFNPVVRLMEPGGNEIVTNVYTKLNNNGLYMMKMIQAKTAFSLSAPGVYTLHIRDITTDRGGEDFSYRVLVRPQIPHIGKMTCSTDHLNLRPGETRTISVTLDREEEFNGVVTLAAEDLPAGVTAIAAMEKPVERPPLPNGGKLERYTPKPQTASLLIIAAPDAAALEQPVVVRVVARPVVNGELRGPVRVADIPLMVLARRPL